MKIDKEKIASTLGESKYFERILQHYFAPSEIIIRTAESELVSSLPIKSPSLDLCCGDGYFASLLGNNLFEYGCDFSDSAILKAKSSDVYKDVKFADVTMELPYKSNFFETIFSNSALEHVNNIDKTLLNVNRVLKPQGKLIFTLASDFAYKWWPCGQKSLINYFNYQPVHNVFSLEEWNNVLFKSGFKLISFQYYLSYISMKVMLFFDYHYSRVFLTNQKTIARPIIKASYKIPKGLLANIWKVAFSNIKILASNSGGGILIIAMKN